MFLGLLAWSLLLQRLKGNWLYFLLMHKFVESIMFLSETHHIEQERRQGRFSRQQLTTIRNRRAEQQLILAAFGEVLVGCIVDYWLLGGHYPVCVK